MKSSVIDSGHAITISPTSMSLIGFLDPSPIVTRESPEKQYVQLSEHASLVWKVRLWTKTSASSPTPILSCCLFSNNSGYALDIPSLYESVKNLKYWLGNILYTSLSGILLSIYSRKFLLGDINTILNVTYVVFILTSWARTSSMSSSLNGAGIVTNLIKNSYITDANNLLSSKALSSKSDLISSILSRSLFFLAIYLSLNNSPSISSESLSIRCEWNKSKQNVSNWFLYSFISFSNLYPNIYSSPKS